jgi:hypothetical protein
VTNPVAVLRGEARTVDGHRLVRKMLHVGCPGCGGAHQVTVEKQPEDPSPLWEWDGSLDAPTVSPSILVRHRVVCHSFLRAGRWEFLADCTHEMAGQTADAIPLPDWLLNEQPAPTTDAQEG